MLHSNLAIITWLYEAPRAALERCREGIDFCERRGITEAALRIRAMIPTFAAELGGVEQALADAGPLAGRLRAAGLWDFIERRAVQLRLLADCGAHHEVSAADELVATARESGDPQMCALAFAPAARLRLIRGRPREARALLAELEQVARIHADPYYAAMLPALVRTALAVGDADLGARLVAGVEPSTPRGRHALRDCDAQLAEASGARAEAAALYADAAAGWAEFGDVSERPSRDIAR